MLQDIINQFIWNPNLKKENTKRLAKRFNVEEEVILQARELANKKKTPLHEKLHELSLPVEAVSKVRYWDKQNGQQGFTIETKKDWLDNQHVVSIEDKLKELKDKFVDEIKPINIEVKGLDNKKALFVYIADTHVGASVENTLPYKNEYNKHVFKERCLEILRTVKQSKTFFGVFDAIYVVDLGDSLDGYNGQTTRGGHRLPQNLNNSEQIDVHFEVKKELFDSIVQLEAAKNIHYICLTNNNHGGDWDYAAQKTVQVYLNVKYPDIKVSLVKEFMHKIEYGQHTFIFTHGKDKDYMKHGFPLILNAKTKEYINNYIHNHKINTPNIHLIKGDLHQSAEEETPIFRYKNVMSLFGGSGYVQTCFNSHKAGYEFEIVDKYSKQIFKSFVEF